jgi:hypothetical protein
MLAWSNTDFFKPSLINTDMLLKYIKSCFFGQDAHNVAGHVIVE